MKNKLIQVNQAILPFEEGVIQTLSDLVTYYLDKGGQSQEQILYFDAMDHVFTNGNDLQTVKIILTVKDPVMRNIFIEQFKLDMQSKDANGDHIINKLLTVSKQSDETLDKQEIIDVEDPRAKAFFANHDIGVTNEDLVRYLKAMINAGIKGSLAQYTKFEDDDLEDIDDWCVRDVVIDGFIKFGDTNGLLSMRDDKNWTLQIKIAAALANLGKKDEGKQVVMKLYNEYANFPNKLIPVRIATALITHGEPEMAKALYLANKDSGRDDVDAEIAQGLAMLEDKEELLKLTEFDGMPLVDVANGLYELGEKDEAIELFQSLKKHDYWFVREYVAKSLAKHGELGELLGMKEEGQYNVKVAIVDGIISIMQSDEQ